MTDRADVVKRNCQIESVDRRADGGNIVEVLDAKRYSR